MTTEYDGPCLPLAMSTHTVVRAVRIFFETNRQSAWSETIIFTELIRASESPMPLTRKFLKFYCSRLKNDFRSTITVAESAELDHELTTAYMDKQASKHKQTVLRNLKPVAENDGRLKAAAHVPIQN